LSSKSKKVKALNIFQELEKLYPDAHCELNYSNPLELLIATILSAQCTDRRVNEVTKVLFSKCKKLEDYLKLSTEELEEIIRPTGFFRSKAKSIFGAVNAIHQQYQGVVPKTLEELITLPGVGRKTANVVLSNVFAVPGLAVDTHVIRLSNRIGLTTKQDPEKIESELCSFLPPKNWGMFSHLLIFHGRRVCFARKPNCEGCPISNLCNYFKKNAAR